MRYVVAGATGRLGRALLAAAGPTARGLTSEERKSMPWNALIADHGPVTVINAAAMSSVAGCAAAPRDALLANALWPAGLARSCRLRGVRLLHVSTDLVYSGGNPPYSERSAAVPATIYGWSKLLGDDLVRRIYPGALVARTSVLFGRTSSAHRTFSQELLSGSVAEVHVDSWRNSTSLSWFASTLLRLACLDVHGLLIVCSRESQTRAAFAEAFLLANGLESFPRQGYRPPGVPRDLTMSPDRAEGILGERMPGLLESIAMEMKPG